MKDQYRRYDKPHCKDYRRIDVVEHSIHEHIWDNVSDMRTAKCESFRMVSTTIGRKWKTRIVAPDNRKMHIFYMPRDMLVAGVDRQAIHTSLLYSDPEVLSKLCNIVNRFLSQK